MYFGCWPVSQHQCWVCSPRVQRDLRVNPNNTRDISQHSFEKIQLTRVNIKGLCGACVASGNTKSHFGPGVRVRITGVDGRATKFRMVLLDTRQNQSRGDIYLFLSVRGLRAQKSRRSSLSHNNVLGCSAQRAAVGTLRFRLWVSKKEQHDAAAPNLGTVTMGPVRPRSALLCCAAYFTSIITRLLCACHNTPASLHLNSFSEEKRAAAWAKYKNEYICSSEASASTFVFFSFQTAAQQPIARHLSRAQHFTGEHCLLWNAAACSVCLLPRLHATVLIIALPFVTSP